MGFWQRLMGKSNDTPLDIKVRDKTRELKEHSERLSISVRAKLSVPPDALDKAIDEDRAKQHLLHSGRNLQISPVIVVAPTPVAPPAPGTASVIIPPALSKDVKEIKADVKEIKKEVKRD